MKKNNSLFDFKLLIVPPLTCKLLILSPLTKGYYKEFKRQTQKKINHQRGYNKEL